MLHKLITTGVLALGLSAMALAPAEARGGFGGGGGRGGGGFHGGFEGSTAAVASAVVSEGSAGEDWPGFRRVRRVRRRLWWGLGLSVWLRLRLSRLRLWLLRLWQLRLWRRGILLLAAQRGRLICIAIAPRRVQSQLEVALF